MKARLPFFIRRIRTILILVLLIKIAGYFSIVEERSVNQVFKTISRVGMTGVIILLNIKFLRFGCQKLYDHKNLLSPVLYGVYLLLGFVSFTWSTNWTYSALQWLMTFESFVFTYFFFRVVFIVNDHFEDRKLDIVELFSWAIFPIMITFIVGSFAAPDVFYRGMRGGEELRLGGWIMNPNELGMLSGIAGALAFMRLQMGKARFWSILMILSAIVVLLMTSSRSSAIGFALILGILILKSENKRMKRIMLVVGVVTIPIMINAVVFKAAGGVEEVMSMTGRLPFWKALLNEGIVKEPFFGYGFMRINYTEYFQGMNTYAAKMTHNTFVQVLMNLGFVGFFIAICQMIVTLRVFRSYKKSDYSKYFIALFIPLLINSFTEFGVFGEANYGILFYQFLIWLFVLQPRKNFTLRERVGLKIFHARMAKFQKPSQIENDFPK
ncbi:MAG: O-antigen ligase family protein [Crocinitomicaceae bacterium]|nr:O-antigen ligase family protein [Crocinitomicaceae bacterium]